MPVAIPTGVTVVVDEGWVKVKGPKGELKTHVLTGTEVAIESGEARVRSERQRRNPAFGTMRANIANMVTGVTAGFSKTLEIVGTGYRASMDGKNLVLQVGYSHPVVFKLPKSQTAPNAYIIFASSLSTSGEAMSDPNPRLGR